MKKKIYAGMLITCSVILAACGVKENTETAVKVTETPVITQEIVVTQEPEATTTPTGSPASAKKELPKLTATPIPTYEPFDGDFSGYVYYYEDERNKDWEQDLVYIAKMFLVNHPRFQNASHMNYPEWEVTNNTKDAVTAYDEQMKEQFLKEINELVLKIESLSDTEIKYEVARIIALLDDLHSGIRLPLGKIFPIGFVALREKEEYKQYVYTTTEETKEILSAHLESINDIPIKEIEENIKKYISKECDEGVLKDISITICSENMLKMAGVLKEEAVTAEFSFVTETGESITITFEFLEDMAEEPEMVSIKPEPTLAYTNSDKHYWYTYIGENTLYIKVNSFEKDTNTPAKEFEEKIIDEIRTATENTKIIMDFRNNNGGIVGLFDLIRISDEINKRENLKVFLLINEASYSAACVNSWALSEKINNAFLVGTPGGQSPNNFGHPKSYKMPNSKTEVSIATHYLVFAPNYEYETVIPDITIYQTLEDYKNGIDTVLEAVLAME